MCGRFAVNAPPKAIQTLFELPELPGVLRPRYNVAPSQKVAAVGLKGDGRRSLGQLQWGLVRSWANGPKDGPAPINARAEGIASKGMFAELVRGRRCLIPATGFYEWKTVGKKKSPHHFRMRDGGPFALAGLWDVWGDASGPKLATFCLITTAPNDVVRAVHDRMPVIVPAPEYARWLDPSTPLDQVTALLRPYPAGEMEGFAVGPAVGKVANDGPECLAPAA